VVADACAGGGASAWPLIREGRATVGAVLNELFGADEVIKMTLAANLSYYHDDPDEMLFLRYAIPQASYLKGGGHYVRGGSQALSDQLVRLIRQADGVVEAGREVDALLLEGERIVGVGHHAREGGDPQVEFAPVVFGNAAPHVLAKMLPENKREAFLAPYGERRLSISLWTISVGLSRPAAEFGVGSYSTFIFPAWMKSLAQMREVGAIMGEEPGDRLPSYVFVDFHKIDSGLNEAGPYLGSFCSVDRLDNWTSLSADAKRARKERWMDRLIGDIDREFPGIARAVVQREMSTADSMHQYLNTPGGAVYGFAPYGESGTSVRPHARDAHSGAVARIGIHVWRWILGRHHGWRRSHARCRQGGAIACAVEIELAIRALSWSGGRRSVRTGPRDRRVALPSYRLPIKGSSIGTMAKVMRSG
jgi:all-trans-retinol 13,14-reductase